jgi:branched-chain amino acid transport system ATP-binding protein
VALDYTVLMGVRHGGLTAIASVNLKAEQGMLHSIIGPKGADKTTLFNMLSGHLVPSRGLIKFNGQDVTGMSVNRISHLGMGRSFQLTNIFRKICRKNAVKYA